MQTKKIMMSRPELLHALLRHLTECLTVYVCHQIDCGAQVKDLRQRRCFCAHRSRRHPLPDGTLARLVLTQQHCSKIFSLLKHAAVSTGGTAV